MWNSVDLEDCDEKTDIVVDKNFQVEKPAQDIINTVQPKTQPPIVEYRRSTISNYTDLIEPKPVFTEEKRIFHTEPYYHKEKNNIFKSFTQKIIATAAIIVSLIVIGTFVYKYIPFHKSKIHQHLHDSMQDVYTKYF